MSTARPLTWVLFVEVRGQRFKFKSTLTPNFLTALDLSELVTETEAEFETLALRLAREPGPLKELRAKLAEKRKSAPLFDTVRTTRDIETAFRIMMEQREKPESFQVPEKF